MKLLNTLKIVGAACLFTFCAFGAKAAEPAAKEATNVILFIGDGMSLAQWQTGMITHQAPLNIEKMRSIGIVKTHSATDFNGDGPTHGTAMASGIATRKGGCRPRCRGTPGEVDHRIRLGKRPGDGHRLRQHFAGRQHRSLRCPCEKQDDDRGDCSGLRRWSCLGCLHRRWPLRIPQPEKTGGT